LRPSAVAAPPSFVRRADHFHLPDSVRSRPLHNRILARRPARRAVGNVYVAVYLNRDVHPRSVPDAVSPAPYPRWCRRGTRRRGTGMLNLADSDALVFKPGADEISARIDSFLASHVDQVSRTRIQRAIEDGDVLVNQRVVKPSYRLRPDDQIELDLPEPPPVELEPEAIPISVVFEDQDLIVVDKAAGMVVHPGAGVSNGTLANALVHHFNELSGLAGKIRPGIVHRIDKDTSGLLIVAKNDLAHERLSDQFHDRTVVKEYIALVYGLVKQDQGEIESRIGRDPRNRTRMAVLKGGAGRPALTLFEVKRRFDEVTLLSIRIRTGRTHQIRVHLASIGHPVVGDGA